MTVGTATVTGFQQKIAAGGVGAISYEDQLYLLKHMDEADRLLRRLKKAAADYGKAAARHGKADQIDRILAAAEQDRTEARDTLSKAREKAKQIGDEAKARAEKILAEAGSEVAKQRDGIATGRKALKAALDDLARRERAFEPLERVALNKQAQLDKELERAKASRADFEGRIAILEQAVRKVKL